MLEFHVMGLCGSGNRRTSFFLRERDLQGSDTVWDFVGGNVVMGPFVRESSVPA